MLGACVQIWSQCWDNKAISILVVTMVSQYCNNIIMCNYYLGININISNNIKNIQVYHCCSDNFLVIFYHQNEGQVPMLLQYCPDIRNAYIVILQKNLFLNASLKIFSHKNSKNHIRPNDIPTMGQAIHGSLTITMLRRGCPNVNREIVKIHRHKAMTNFKCYFSPLESSSNNFI